LLLLTNGKSVHNPAGGQAMIFKRAAARLRAQDWVAITIELGIVIIGVFIGMWAADLNQRRSDKREVRQLLLQLKPELANLQQFADVKRAYYATTRRYAETAFAGWSNDPKINDEDFVIAAYQASQVSGLSNNGQSWAMIFGGGRLGLIADANVRRPLQRVMTVDYTSISYQAVATRYRDDVRLVIPDSIQQAIRARCGDQLAADGFTLTLPATCTVSIPQSQAAAAARALRSHPELVRELAQHQATVGAFLSALNQLETQTRVLAGVLSDLH